MNKFAVDEKVVINFNNKTSFGIVKSVEPRYVEQWMIARLPKFKNMQVGQHFSDLITVEEYADGRLQIKKLSKYDSTHISKVASAIELNAIPAEDVEIQWRD